MQEKYIKVCLGVCLVILFFIIVISLYVYLSKSKKSVENFTSEDASNLDLLKKVNANKTESINSITDGSSITKWSNKFYNLNTNNPLKQISLWKPKLPISNGKTMYKLGDMISQDIIYAPPTDKSLFVSGDVKSPIDYKQVLDFTGTELPAFLGELDAHVNDLTELNNIYNLLQNSMNFIQNVNNVLINTNKDIVSDINQTLIDNINVKFDTLDISLKDLQSLNASTTPIEVVSNNLNSVITLPAGVTMVIRKLDSSHNPIPSISPKTVIIPLTANNLSGSELDKLPISLKTIKTLGKVKAENVKTYIVSKVMKDIPNIDYIVQPIIDGVYAEINAFKLKYPDLSAYLNLDAALASLQNYIDTYIKFKYNYTYVELKAADLDLFGFSTDNLNISISFEPYDGLSLARNIQNQQKLLDITLMPEYQNSNIKKFITNMSSMSQLRDNIDNGTLNLFSFKIFEPVPPPKYIALGHIFTAKNDTVDKLKDNLTIGCVPQTCVKEVRTWINTDMVFEYSNGPQYFSIFYNPYIGTFTVCNRPGLPDSKVYKVVACVKPCTIVDELIKADKCSRDFKKINRNFAQNAQLTPSLEEDEEDKFYLDKINKQSQQVAMLEMRAKQMQLSADKAEIINSEFNKHKLQNYVDTQKRNIDLVMKKLNKDNNNVDVEVNIPIAVINEILKRIRESENIPPETKKDLIAKIVNNKTLADSNIITLDQYKSNLNKIISTCNDYDLNGFVRKDVASQVCYGCDVPR